jgi:hypothetical protein
VALSHDPEMVSLFRPQTIEAQLDADDFGGVLGSNGIAPVSERIPSPPLA